AWQRSRTNTGLPAILVQRLLAHDIDSTLEFLSADIYLTQLGYTGICELARRQPDKVVDWVLTSTREKYRASAAQCLILNEGEELEHLDEIMAAAGPEADDDLAMRSLDSMPPWEAFSVASNMNSGMRRIALNNAISRWLREDINGAIAAAAEVNDHNDRHNLIITIIRQIAPEDPRLALQVIKTQMVGYGFDWTNYYTPVFNSLSYEQGYLLAQQDVAETGTYQVMGAYIHHVAKTKSVREALDLISQLPNSTATKTREALARSYFEQSPHEAADWSVKHSVRNGMKRYIERYPDRAARLLSQVEDVDYRDYLLGNIARAKAKHGPEDTIRWLEKFKNTPGYRNAVFQAINEWGLDDPPGAIAYIEQQENRTDLLHTMPYVFDQWLRKSPAAAREWTRAAPQNSIGRQVAIGIIAVQEFRDDPLAAGRTIKALSNDWVRNRQLLALAHRWANLEPSRLDYIAETLDLSPEQAGRLRKAINRN
ncbi:MAG: hypothetical protein HUJ31_07695, partial [Pseudomonadales bacterium]|nr:hypothetical protein [Pseudomonadales bacterium]